MKKYEIMETIDNWIRKKGERNLEISPNSAVPNSYTIYPIIGMTEFNTLCTELGLYEEIKEELAINKDLLTLVEGKSEYYNINTDFRKTPYLCIYLFFFREVVYRMGGMGVGKLDYHHGDIAKENCFSQLITIKKNTFNQNMIVGSYCHGLYHTIKHHDPIDEFCEYSDEFISKKYAQLRRAFTSPLHRSSGIHVLFHGMGALVNYYESLPDPAIGFYGKVTIPYWMKDETYTLIHKINTSYSSTELIRIKQDQQVQVSGLFESSPNHIMLSIYEKCVGKNNKDKLYTYGAVFNEHDGASTENGILVHFKDFDPKMRERYITPYKNVS